MQNITTEVFPLLDRLRVIWNKTLDWLIEGPENKLLRIFVYWPVFLITTVVIIFLVFAIIPELIAWCFGFSCIIWVVVWPITKIYELITGRKVL
ncbi:MAG: hypothetical protein WC364_04975 [Eubacteriales bacterium]|jgi:hypothetical protein